MANDYRAAARTAEDYYDSPDADAFYEAVWGGEDIHVGLYETPDENIKDASARTVREMAGRLPDLTPETGVLDLGAGYGGAARYLARTHGCHVTCLNLSGKENARNRVLNEAQGLVDKIEVVHGSFEDIPFEDGLFDVVWSQDAILHSGARSRVIGEAARVLRPGGHLIFTDPMQTDTVETEADRQALQPIYERIHLPDLGSISFYREVAKQAGLEEVAIDARPDQLRNHYNQVRNVLTEERETLSRRISPEYIDRMIAGLKHWVDGADAGRLTWAIMQFKKPGQVR
jgi:sarcosine/dimethylglycine N-methyltransferase